MNQPLSPAEWRRLSRAEKDRLRAEKHARRNESLQKSLEHQAIAAQRSNHKVSGTPFVTVDGTPLDLRDLYRGGSAFVVLSGPSLRTLDLSLLWQRGCWTIGINNSPAVFRPSWWTYSDRPNKFHQSIWMDPYIIKSVCATPRPHLRNCPLRAKRNGKIDMMHWPDGSLVYPREMPGVIGHVRSNSFEPAVWLSEPAINRGNSRKSAIRNGGPRCLNTMFAVLKTVYVLGFRTVYLLGCDFYMKPEDQYAFRESKGINSNARAGIASSNNHSYNVMAGMFRQLKPYFDDAGFKVFNCNPSSRLDVFDHVRYDVAVNAATSHIPQELDTEGWYSLE